VRIAIGQLWQETNTFNPLPTVRDDFERFGVLRGPQIIEQLADTNEIGGFIQSLRAWPERPEIVGLVRLPAWPSGRATPETFAWLREELVTSLRAAGPVDGVLLALHGAMVAEGAPDVEGDILVALREVIGPKIPIVATLDLHANVTERMVRSAEALVLFHTAPHIDVFETGQRGAALLRKILIDGARPVVAFQKIPAVVPAERANTEDPASVSHALKARLVELEAQPGVLTAGLATVQPWLDIPELGAMAIVVTNSDAEQAKTACADLANEFWRARTDYLPTLTPTAEAVARAAARQEGLTVLSDSADATTSGAPGDSTWVLAELLRREWTREALVTLVAPEIVAEAERLGVGGRFAGPIGGVRDHRFSRPINITATVERLFDARFVLSGHLARNLPIDMGRSAVLGAGNVKIIVTSRSGPHFAPQLFEAAGFDPFAAQVLVAKSPCGFRAAYAGRAQEILVVDAPGCAPPNFSQYEYDQIDRPLWPWDEIKEWQAEPTIVSTKTTRIFKQQMMEMLLAACPSFKPNWREFVDEWKDEPVETPYYLALGDYSRHLEDMLRLGDTAAFPAIFQVIEQLHLEGDSYVKEAATIGILESLLSEQEPNPFRPFFGRETERWWNKLNRFWDGDATALRD
jgi:microcystin degradation protein MlrC